MALAILKITLCLLGFIGVASAVEISTRKERLNLWLDMQLVVSFGLMIAAAFI